MLDAAQKTVLKQAKKARLSAIGASQMELEELYAKSQLVPAMREDFRSDFTSALEEIGIPVEFGLDLLVQAALHKRAGVETLVGILRHHFLEEENPTQACADMLYKAAEQDVIDWDPERLQFVMRYDIQAETQARIDQFQYPLPMIEKPQPITNNRQTGYRTIKGSVILKNNHHEDDVCLDHLNQLNGIALAINPQTVAFVQNQWKNLDKKKPGETHDDFQKRRKAFAKYDRVSRDVISAMLMSENGFHLTHKYDKRGRTYCQGYQVTYQGTDWNKACIELARPEKLKDF